MADVELTEAQQREILRNAGWFPVSGEPLGGGGGARVFRVVRNVTMYKVDAVLNGPGDRDKVQARAIEAAALLADVANGTERLVAAAKVGKHPDHLLKREIGILRDVQHRNLIQMLDHDKTEKPSWYVMPVMRGALKGDKDFEGDVVGVIRGMLQIARALAALHRHNNPSVHRDVKPANIFIDDEGEWILGDPGVAHREDDGEKTHTVMWSKDWAPRWYDDPHANLPKTDLYMLGATCLAMVVGEKPLAPSYLDEPAFNLAERFPDVPGIRMVGDLFRRLIVSRAKELPYEDAAELVPTLEQLLVVVENDRASQIGAALEKTITDMRADHEQNIDAMDQQLTRVAHTPRTIFTFSNQNAMSGDHEGLRRVPVFIPRDCDQLLIWPRAHDRQHRCGARVMDTMNRQLITEISSMADDTPAMLAIRPEHRGQFVRLTITERSAMLASLVVFAVGPDVSLGGILGAMLDDRNNEP